MQNTRFDSQFLCAKFLEQLLDRMLLRTLYKPDAKAPYVRFCTLVPAIRDKESIGSMWISLSLWITCVVQAVTFPNSEINSGSDDDHAGH